MKRPGECISLTRTLITLKKFYFFKFYPKFYTSNVFWWKLAWRKRLGVEQSTKFHWNATQVNYGWNSRPFKVECVNLQFQDAQLDSAEVPVDHGDRVLSLPTVNWPVKSPANLTFLFCPSLACCFFFFFSVEKKGKFTMTDYYLVPAIRPPPEYFFEGLWACQCRLYSSDFVWNGPEIADRRKDKFVPNWLGPTVSIERLPLAAHVSSFLPSFHLRVGQTRRNVTNHFVVKWFIQILINEWIVISIRQPSVLFQWNFQVQVITLVSNNFKFNVQKITNRREINWWGDTLIQSCH